MSSSIQQFELPIWHVATESEQIGPLTSVEVRERFAAGQLGERAYAWREGFAEWLPIAAVRGFEDLQREKPVQKFRASVTEISSLFDSLNGMTGGGGVPDSAHSLTEYLSWADEELGGNTGMADIRRISRGYVSMQPVQVDPDVAFAIGSSPELPIVPEALVMPTVIDTGPDLIRVLVATATALAVVTMLLAALAIA